MADTMPTQRDVMNKFEGVEDMLSYVKSFQGTRIEAPKVTPQNPTPQAAVSTEATLPGEVLAETNAKRAEAEAAPAPAPEVSLDTVQYDLNPVNPAKPTEVAAPVTPETAPEAQEAVEVPEELQEEDPKALNFKKLRTTLREKETELQTRTRAFEELETKVKKYETGEELPEVAKQLEQRVRELEPYQKLHALKLSPAYKEAFITPVQQIREKIAEIGADYNIPEEIMSEALNIENKAELNRFLSNHFDDVGALEVKQLITQARDITGRAKQAEQEPARAMEQLQAEYKTLQDHRRARSNSVIASTSKDAWAESLMQIRDEGKALELIYKDGDSEHNKTYVEPVLKNAASEYGKLVKMLAENGLENLPKDVAKALARMVQLAHASAIAIETRSAAERELDTITKNNQRNTRYVRPGIGGGVGGQGSVPSKPKNLEDAVDRLVASVTK